MRKKLLLMCAAVTMFLGTVTGQNFISNGDMKIWPVNDSVPQGFQITGGVSTGLSHTYFNQAEGREGAGDYAIMCKRDDTGSGNYRLVSPRMSFTQNGTYKLSFYLKGKGRLSWIRISTNASSAGTNDVLGVYSFDLADWTLHEYNFEITDAPKSYYLLFMMNSVTDQTNPILFDDVSVVSAPSSVATLKSIKFQNPTTQSSEGNFSLPGFNAANTNYTFPLWFGCDTVPTIITEVNSTFSTYAINYGSSKKFSETNDPSVKTKTVTITVTAENGTENDYDITFDRTDFVAGFFYNFAVGDGHEFAASTSGFKQNDMGHGSFWGTRTFRPNSTNGGSITTTKLINGAGTLTFWTGKYSGTTNAELNIKVTYTTDGSIWNDVPNGLVRIDSAALNGNWTEISLPILQSNPDTQVKLEYVKGASAAAYSPINMDDMRITPYAGTSIPDAKIISDIFNVYPKEQNIVIAEEGTYKVYTVSGQLIASGNSIGQSIISVKSGLYIVKMDNQTKKIIVK